MMKKISLLFLIFVISCSAYAQVGINTKTPHASAALDIVSTDKGILIPRMTTAQKLAIANPATALLVYDITLHQLYQNAGTPTTPLWVPLVIRDTKNSFFYMPSISIDASAVATNQTLDLYDEYKKQFTGGDANTFKASDGAPGTIPYFPNSEDLHYYITYYDNAVVKVNDLTKYGVLNYDILKESGYDSFMNVVFVVKPQ